jgi:hypothetical protein
LQSSCGGVLLLCFFQPEAARPTRDDTLQDVIADLVKDFADPGGTDARDLAVWRDGRIPAVIRRGQDGRPEVTRFDPDG